jgi:hypothetical protein
MTMTERNWLDALDPLPMLQYIENLNNTPAQIREMERKVWLFFMACMSSIAGELPACQRRIYEVVRVRSPYAQRISLSAVTDFTMEASVMSPEPRAERAKQAALMRCIFGNPFRPVSLNRVWLHRNAANVSRIARRIYSEGTFRHLPDLLNALETAGCDSAEIWAHCLETQEHVRGCWVIDLLASK